MPIRAAVAGIGGGGGGSTIICSHRQLELSNRRYFLCLNPNSPPQTTLLPQTRSKSGIFFVNQQQSHKLRFRLISKAVDSTQSSPSVTAAVNADKPIVPDEEFTLAKVSFGVIGLGLGVTLLSYGFGAYFNILPGSEWSALMLTYGFPLAIIGMALKYAELKPVPCLTYSDAQKLRETCATPILKQVRNDVIRFRYGDEQHLEEALKRIFQYGQGGGIPRRSAPILKMIREEVTEDGKYSLVLVFEAKALQLSDFEKRQIMFRLTWKQDHFDFKDQFYEFELIVTFKAKFASFFGPGITAEVGKGENNLYEVQFISETAP